MIGEELHAGMPGAFAGRWPFLLGRGGGNGRSVSIIFAAA
jgi:hypothetical protein